MQESGTYPNLKNRGSVRSEPNSSTRRIDPDPEKEKVKEKEKEARELGSVEPSAGVAGGGKDDILSVQGTYGRGIATLGMYGLYQYVMALVITLTVAVTLGDHFESVVHNSPMYIAILFFFLSGVGALVAIFASSNNHITAHYFSLSVLFLSVVFLWISLFLVFLLVTDDTRCFAESICMEYPKWLGLPERGLAAGCSSRRRQTWSTSTTAPHRRGAPRAARGRSFHQVPCSPIVSRGGPGPWR
jgi:hypothetical protein